MHTIITILIILIHCIFQLCIDEKKKIFKFQLQENWFFFSIIGNPNDPVLQSRSD